MTQKRLLIMIRNALQDYDGHDMVPMQNFRLIGVDAPGEIPELAFEVVDDVSETTIAIHLRTVKGTL